MADEIKKEAKPEENIEVKPDEEKKTFKQEKPWEHFKKSSNFKNFKSHGASHMNRRTGGGA
jgi:hypothetical protein